MNILITGGLGHIGSNLINKLILEKYVRKIFIIDNLSTERYVSLFNIPKKKIIFLKNNVISKEFTKKLKLSDIVIHLAAQTDATKSLEHPQSIYKNNYKSTKFVVDQVCKFKKKLIFISSTSVYGPQEKDVSEKTKITNLHPQSPYARCKLKEESYIKKIFKSKQLNDKFNILRFGTIFGYSPGMRFHTAVNKFCWQAVFNEPLTIWKTALYQKRPYLGINDSARAIIHILKKDIFKNEIYNVLNFNKEVKEIIDIIQIKIPNAKIRFVKNRIMNQDSYSVISNKFIDTGFKYKDSLKKLIFEEIKILK